MHNPQEIYQPAETFHTHDGDINYRYIGSGPEQLIFLHGFAMSLYAWDDIREKFSTDTYRMLFVDLKGCGFSSKEPGDYSLKCQVNLLLALMEHLGIHQPIVIGHSYGGLVTLYLEHTLRHTSTMMKLKKIVLIDAPAYTEHVPSFLKALQNPLLGFITLNLVSSGWNAGFIIKTTFYHWRDALKRLHHRYRFFLKTPGSHDGLRFMAKQIMPADASALISGYRHMETPVLILWGKQDQLIPLHQGERLHADIPGSKFIVLSGCGHVPQEECPELAFQAIIQFIEAD